ncbi:MAG: hypothetical protein A3J48_01005 [Candidatus Doudnabacteria bacterium RIFCSPHIGHO2_02_FULL_46_11]|uniref:DUF218 domain-containing protein n=1 Tax=Candidatus Doudnabacteria bacterium RIFCSPHIGHO2_02_FULL_46_11 TaxID=1817832 RepID=A0A1F5P8C0_9BACT|nr:MAG: hypothetical protein A3J48_01005 [Candidatus Doudnabacteria bacterium RIFCSPHIGHO2_02_FULL_46_11]
MKTLFRFFIYLSNGKTPLIPKKKKSGMMALMFAKKILKIAVKVFAGILVVDLLFVLVMSQISLTRKSEAIIILGAAINTPALYNRTITALELYEQGLADMLVLSGGQGIPGRMTEAENMRQIILENSQKTPNLIIEDQSHSTIENIKNSREKIPEAKSIIIVSDKFHLARAYLIAKRNGFASVNWTGPKSDYYSDKELFYYYFREVAALIIDAPKILMN